MSSVVVVSTGQLGVVVYTSSSFEGPRPKKARGSLTRRSMGGINGVGGKLTVHFLGYDGNSLEGGKVYHVVVLSTIANSMESLHAS